MNQKDFKELRRNHRDALFQMLGCPEKLVEQRPIFGIVCWPQYEKLLRDEVRNADRLPAAGYLPVQPGVEAQGTLYSPIRVGVKADQEAPFMVFYDERGWSRHLGVKTVKYVLCPGWVRSRIDGERHHIPAPQLAELYKVSLDECFVADRGQPVPTEFFDLPYLVPRYDGNYQKP